MMEWKEWMTGLIYKKRSLRLGSFFKIALPLGLEPRTL
jgi:hypothetical protein